MNNPADSTPTTIHPGDQVGKYRIELQIGSGGGAIVWRGIDPLLNKIVAIKQLAPSTLDMETQTSQKAEWLVAPPPVLPGDNPS